MMLHFLTRPTKIVKISSANSEVNLYTLSGNPSFALSLFCVINANLSSSNTSNPALRTGTGWKSGTTIFIDNNATISGAIGTTGSTGANGANGAGGLGGNGGLGISTLPTNGSPGSPGSAGSAGGNGSTGEHLFMQILLLV